MNALMKMKMLTGDGSRGREYQGGERPRAGYYSGGYEPMDARFRDRTGREHYDNGRFAPMRSEYQGGSTGGGYFNGGYGEGYDSPRIGNDAEDYRRKWTITENNGYRPDHSPSAQYRGEMNDDGMRRIYGFGVMEGGRAQSHYRGPDHGDEMEHRRSEMMRGYGGSEAVPPMTKERAEEWMRSLKNEDGSTGPHWTLEQVKALLQQRGIANVDPIRVWVAMNADYSDRVAVNRKYGMDKPDYYLDSAIAAWINDKDAVENKEAAYYAYIVK